MRALDFNNRQLVSSHPGGNAEVENILLALSSRK